MQIGVDVGATKIESVVLEKDGQEKHRSRILCPKNYTQIITSIRDIHRQLEQEFKQELPHWCLSSRSSLSSNRVG
jgi:fructokinase